MGRTRNAVYSQGYRRFESFRFRKFSKRVSEPKSEQTCYDAAGASGRVPKLFMKNIDFIKTAVQDYHVGALTKSSRYTVRAVVKHINPLARVIVEYGAGDGIVTKKLLDRLPPQGKLAAIEMNKALLPHLRRIRDPRLSVIEGDAIMLSKNFGRFGCADTDAVVSSIPFTFLTPKKREELIHNTRKNLARGGQFIVFQYTPLVFPLLKKHFKQVKVYYEVRNFLPYFIMVAE